jgi:glycosyltransferase involved in cell wall biosynthesis
MEHIDIIVFPFHDWKKCQAEGLVRRDTQIIHEIEKNPLVKNILIVERPISTAIIFWKILRRQNWMVNGSQLRYRTFSSYLWQTSDKIFVLDTIISEPFTTLFLRKRWWPYILKQSKILKTVRQAVKCLNLENIVLWLFTPISASVIGQLDESLVVFDAIDNWVEHEGMKAYHAAAKKGYAEMRKRANLIFCGSKSMQSFLQGNEAKVYWIPNGVDLDFFQPKSNNRNIPKDLMEIPRPRIGYAGMMDKRIDVDLINFAAARLPNFNFVFVGPIYEIKYIKSQLSNLSNVYFLWHKRYEEIPNYINNFDVCIIPHKVNKYTDGMNPLKLYEYLACGKPVVSTAIAGTELFQSVIRVAETKESFAMAIQESMTAEPDQIIERRNAVKGYSWTSRVDEMMFHISRMLKHKVPVLRES